MSVSPADPARRATRPRRPPL